MRQAADLYGISESTLYRQLETTLSERMDDLKPTLIRHGYTDPPKFDAVVAS